MSDAQTDRRPVAWLAVGAACGLALAIRGLLVAPEAPVPQASAGRIVARVNGVALLAEPYQRQLEAYAAEPDPARRRHVLDRMIDEELLVQRALALGLAQHDRRVRADLVAAMIDSVNAQADARTPDDAELGAFYAENRRYFQRPPRLRVQELFVSDNGPGAAERAADLRARLDAGATFEAIRADADDPIAPLPDVLLPRAKLREYVGPSALTALEALQPGEAAGPIGSRSGWRILKLVERDAVAPRDFSSVSELVRAEWRRRTAERALREYLAELRSRSAIEIATE